MRCDAMASMGARCVRACRYRCGSAVHVGELRAQEREGRHEGRRADNAETQAEARGMCCTRRVAGADGVADDGRTCQQRGPIGCASGPVWWAIGSMGTAWLSLAREMACGTQ
jgi:hypothetical protein